MIVKLGKEVVLEGDEADVATDVVIVALALAKTIGKEKAEGTLKLAVELMEENDEKKKRTDRKSDDKCVSDSSTRCFIDWLRGNFFV